MRRTLERAMYRLCWRGNWLSDLIAPLWFRWYCPYPLHDDWTARHCLGCGDCGCGNSRREAHECEVK
jgi:hypothetical protein